MRLFKPLLLNLVVILLSLPSASAQDLLYHKDGKLFTIKRDRGKCGLANEAGLLTPLKYDQIEPLYRYQSPPTHFMISVDGKLGILDTLGKELTPIQYDYFEARPRNTLIKARIGKDWALLDRQGQQLTPAIYQNAIQLFHSDSRSAYLVHRNGKAGLLSAAGKELTPIVYDDIHVEPKPDLIQLTKGKQVIFTDRYGSEVLRTQKDLLPASFSSREALISRLADNKTHADQAVISSDEALRLISQRNPKAVEDINSNSLEVGEYEGASCWKFTAETEKRKAMKGKPCHKVKIKTYLVSMETGKMVKVLKGERVQCYE